MVLAPEGLRIYGGPKVIVRSNDGKQLLLVSSKDILLATTEICVNLARQESIFRYLRLS